MNNLAPIYWDQGRHAEAEKLEVEVLETKKQVLGPEYPDTLLTMNNLASTLDSWGHSNKDVALSAPALELSKRIFGPRHPRTRLYSENLLIMYRKLG